jgi:tryptophan-rich sensory protein
MFANLQKEDLLELNYSMFVNEKPIMSLKLLSNIGLMYAILIIINIPAPFLGLEFEPESKPRLWYQPPGFVIPIVWFVLFTLLAVARYQLMDNELAKFLSVWIIALAILCAMYAYYTIGLAKVTGISPLWFGLWGNIAVIIFAVIVCFKTYNVLPSTAWLVLPICIWTSFATLIVIGQMKVEKLL